MKNLVLLAAVAVLSLSSETFGADGESVKTKPTIVFVHGLWADGTCWNKIITPLVEKGHPVISVQNPTTALEDDVAATKTAIERAGGDVILVGHSWGGFVITAAGTHPHVKGLVYVAAFAPDTGDTVPTLSTNAGPTQLSDFLQNHGGGLTLSRKGIGQVFAGDLTTKEQDLIYAVQPPASPKVFAGACSEPAWKTKPSWYLVASEDKTINPELQKWMAKRAVAKTTILKSSHVAMLSKPKEVMNAILDAANSAGK